jgi:hypothetical protein
MRNTIGAGIAALTIFAAPAFADEPATADDTRGQAESATEAGREDRAAPDRNFPGAESKQADGGVDFRIGSGSGQPARTSADREEAERAERERVERIWSGP